MTVASGDAELVREYSEAEAGRASALQHLAEARARREEAAQAWMAAAEAARLESSAENLKQRDDLRAAFDDSESAKTDAEASNRTARARFEVAESMRQVVEAGGADATSLMRGRRELAEAEAQHASTTAVARQAEEKLAAVEVRRRSFVIDAVLNDPAASRSLKAANAAREEAMQAVEDLQIATNATGERVAAKRAALASQIARGLLGKVIGLGIKRVEMLRDIRRRIEELFAQYGAYTSAGAEISRLILQSGKPPLGVADRIRTNTSYDRQNFAQLLAQSMPFEMLSEMPDQRFRERDFVTIESELYQQLQRAVDAMTPTDRKAA